MWIDRDVEELLHTRARQRPVVVVTGARQTGKTSLVQRLFPDWELVSLDLPSEAEQAGRDPSSFLRRHPPPLIVDEVQYAPELFRHLKVVVDAQRKMNGQFVLTGSQSFPLMRSVSESLAGRADIIELETLSWAEVSRAIPELTVETFLGRGGFPELYENFDLDAQAFYRSYVATYLERDLRDLLQVTSLRDFERFIRACALRSGQLLNRAELARDVGISGSTVANWLSVLEASGQIRLLEPWFSNRTKSLVKSPKLYLVDTGLCGYLTGARSPDDLAESPMIGAFWETLVFGEIRRRQLSLRGGWDLHFFRDRTREADFLFHRAGKFELGDAKWTENPAPKSVAPLRRVKQQLPRGSTERLTIVCRSSHCYPLADDAEACPLHELPESWI